MIFISRGPASPRCRASPWGWHLQGAGHLRGAGISKVLGTSTGAATGAATTGGGRGCACSCWGTGATPPPAAPSPVRLSTNTMASRTHIPTHIGMRSLTSWSSPSRSWSDRLFRRPRESSS